MANIARNTELNELWKESIIQKAFTTFILQPKGEVRVIYEMLSTLFCSLNVAKNETSGNETFIIRFIGHINLI